MPEKKYLSLCASFECFEYVKCTNLENISCERAKEQKKWKRGASVDRREEELQRIRGKAESFWNNWLESEGGSP